MSSKNQSPNKIKKILPEIKLSEVYDIATSAC
jgi:hypothetical protein